MDGHFWLHCELTVDLVLGYLCICHPNANKGTYKIGPCHHSLA